MKVLSFLILFLSILTGTKVFANIFVPVTPELKKELEKSLPILREAIAEDEILAKDLGGQKNSDLYSISFDFSRMLKLEDFDYDKLYEVETFANLILQKSIHFSIPLCINDSCNGIALFTWENNKFALQYAGRVLQAQEFQSAQNIIANLGADTEGVKIITTDILNFVYIPQLDGRQEKIVPAGQQTEDIVRSALDLNYEGASSDLSLQQFRALVQKREELWQAANDDEMYSEFLDEERQPMPEDILPKEILKDYTTSAPDLVDTSPSSSDGHTASHDLVVANQKPNSFIEPAIAKNMLAPSTKLWLLALLSSALAIAGVVWLNKSRL